MEINNVNALKCMIDIDPINGWKCAPRLLAKGNVNCISLICKDATGMSIPGSYKHDPIILFLMFKGAALTKGCGYSLSVLEKTNDPSGLLFPGNFSDKDGDRINSLVKKGACVDSSVGVNQNFIPEDPAGYFGCSYDEVFNVAMNREYWNIAEAVLPTIGKGARIDTIRIMQIAERAFTARPTIIENIGKYAHIDVKMVITRGNMDIWHTVISPDEIISHGMPDHTVHGIRFMERLIHYYPSIIEKIKIGTHIDAKTIIAYGNMDIWKPILTPDKIIFDGLDSNANEKLRFMERVIHYYPSIIEKIKIGTHIDVETIIAYGNMDIWKPILTPDKIIFNSIDSNTNKKLRFMEGMIHDYPSIIEKIKIGTHIDVETIITYGNMDIWKPILTPDKIIFDGPYFNPVARLRFIEKTVKYYPSIIEKIKIGTHIDEGTIIAYGNMDLWNEFMISHNTHKWTIDNRTQAIKAARILVKDDKIERLKYIPVDIILHVIGTAPRTIHPDIIRYVIDQDPTLARAHADKLINGIADWVTRDEYDRLVTFINPKEMSMP